MKTTRLFKTDAMSPSPLKSFAQVVLGGVIVSALLITPFGCTRKGDGDPLVSLRTRKARLDGVWKIVSGKGSYRINSTDEAWTYDGSSFIYSSGNIQTPGQSNKVEFGKDGHYEWTTLINMPNSGGPMTIVETGRWNFKTGKDDSKRKEEIILQPEHVFPYPQNGQLPFERVFELQTLRNEKVVLKRSYAIFNYQGYDPLALVNNEEWTLEPDNN
ncbi:MAG: hypothetical protein ACRC3B_02625 [Bacteroidia bacterium]